MPASSAAVHSSDATEQEVQLLVDLVRLSRVTVLYAEAGFDKSTFLHERVMPVLRSTCGTRRELYVLFDRWEGRPLQNLLREAHLVVAAHESVEELRTLAVNPQSVAATLGAWQQKLGVTFVFILDQFEKYLAAASDRPEVQEFDRALVLLMNGSHVPGIFLLLLDHEAAPLLGRLQECIPGLGDASLRLPPATVAPGEAADVLQSEPWFGSTRDSAPSADPLRQENREAVQTSPQASGRLQGTPYQSVTSIEETHEVRRAQPNPGPAPVMQDAHYPAGSSAAPAELSRSKTQRAAIGPAEIFAVAVILVCLSCLVLLAWWQPARAPMAAKSSDSHAASVAPSSPSASAAPDADAAPASPVDDEIALGEQPDSPQQLDGSTASSGPARVPVVTASQPKPVQPVQAPSAPAAANNSAATRAKQAVRGAPLALFIHVRSEAQRAQAERLIKPLARRGIRVTGIKIVNTGPLVTDLRYFHPEDTADLARVRRVLRELGLAPPKIKHIAGFETRATPRQYELWLAPRSAAASR